MQVALAVLPDGFELYRHLTGRTKFQPTLRGGGTGGSAGPGGTLSGGPGGTPSGRCGLPELPGSSGRLAAEGRRGAAVPAARGYRRRHLRHDGAARAKSSVRSGLYLLAVRTAETKADAEEAFEFFIRACRAKYDKAVECLTKDRDRLLTFYDFPAEHWKHVL